MNGKGPDEFLFPRQYRIPWQGDHVVRDDLKPLRASLIHFHTPDGGDGAPIGPLVQNPGQVTLATRWILSC